MVPPRKRDSAHQPRTRTAQVVQHFGADEGSFLGFVQRAARWPNHAWALLPRSDQFSKVASAQTFLGYAKRSARHRIASIRYESLRRDMAQAMALPPGARPDAQKELDRVRTRMEKYAKESPALPEALWRRLCRKFDIKPNPPPIQ